MLNLIISTILFIVLVFFQNKKAIELGKKGYKIVAGISFLVFSIINKDPMLILILMIAIWIKECYIRDTYNINERTVMDDIVKCLIYLAILIFLIKNMIYAMFGI
jgi:hypothetical protein